MCIVFAALWVVTLVALAYVFNAYVNATKKCHNLEKQLSKIKAYADLFMDK